MELSDIKTLGDMQDLKHLVAAKEIADDEITDYLDDVANDLSAQTGMTSSAWQTVSNGLTFSGYKIMEFKK